MKKLLLHVKKWTLANKKKAAIIYSSVSVLLIVAIVAMCIAGSSNSAAMVAYKEEPVTYGTLTVGVTESGSVTVGTTIQTLDIDISEYSGSTESLSPGGNGMGMMGGGQNQSSDSSSSSDSENRVLEVEEVYIAVGEEIAKGDKIGKLNSESVTSIRSELEEDLTSAQNAYDQALAQQQVTDLSADSEYSINSMYGSYASTELNTETSELTSQVEDAQEELDEANETLTEYREELATEEENLVSYKDLVTNAEYTLSGIDKETSLYGWLDAENYREEAQEMLDTCEENIETLTDNISDQETKVKELEIALEEAKKDCEIGEVEAKADYDIHTLYYNNSSELLEVTKLQSALTVEMAADDLANAKAKIDEFDKYIVNDEIVSAYSGVISEVDIAQGDELYSDSNIMVINDYGAITVTVDVDEDDIDSASLGANANVAIEAFPDILFDATVTDIGDATYDSSTETTSYEVTVTLSDNDVLSELYTGMTCDVTFITTDTKDVLYIPNRAVTRQDGVSTVKVKDSSGKVKTVEIETGFSDGSNVEVKSGLSEGDTVIIESKVN